MKVEADLIVNEVHPGWIPRIGDHEQEVIDRLTSRFPTLDPAKLKLFSVESVIWNNGALGCPIDGEFYTQALVPGYRLTFIQEGLPPIHVHTNRLFTTFRMPGIGAL